MLHISEDLKKVLVDKILYCPHDKKEKCKCRKPKTGLIKNAIKGKKIYLKESYIIGDRASDIEAGIKAGLPIETILFLPMQDATWGERLVALIRWNRAQSSNEISTSLTVLQRIVSTWLPAERPVAWHGCPELVQNEAGKWERDRWKDWLEAMILQKQKPEKN